MLMYFSKFINLYQKYIFKIIVEIELFEILSNVSELSVLNKNFLYTFV